MKRNPMAEIDRVLVAKLRQATNRVRNMPGCAEARETWDRAAMDLARHRQHWLQPVTDEDEPEV